MDVDHIIFLKCAFCTFGGLKRLRKSLLYPWDFIAVALLWFKTRRDNNRNQHGDRQTDTYMSKGNGHFTMVLQAFFYKCSEAILSLVYMTYINIPVKKFTLLWYYKATIMFFARPAMIIIFASIVLCWRQLYSGSSFGDDHSSMASEKVPRADDVCIDHQTMAVAHVVGQLPYTYMQICIKYICTYKLTYVFRRILEFVEILLSPRHPSSHKWSLFRSSSLCVFYFARLLK